MKNTTVLLCAINSKFIHSSPAVYSLKAAADSVLPENEFETFISESSINDTAERIIYRIMNCKPDIIGFSVYIWNVELVAKICKTVKSVNPLIKIILGGPEVSYGICHTNISENDYDMIVSGEGERAFPAAVLYLCGKSTEKTDNIHFGKKTVMADLIGNLDDIPFIYNEGNIMNFDNRIIYYESSRGCPFSCAYCLSSVCGKVRCLSEKRVFSDLDFFINHNVKQVKFADRTFNCTPERAYRIWEYIYSRRNDSITNFHFEIGADLLTDKQIQLLKEMPEGKIQLEAGIQSTNKETLTESCRYAPNDIIFKNLSQLREKGNINIHTDLIAGLPYESYERFIQSFNEVYSLKSHQLQLGFLKLLSGAPLNNLKEKHGYSFTSYPPYEIIRNNCISYEEIQILKETEDILEKYYNSMRFCFSLDKAISFFDSPFEMYREISEFFKKKKLLFTGVSSKKLYDLLNEFLSNKGIDIKRTLLKDFYVSENSELPPVSLKHLIPLNKYSKPVSAAILKEYGFSQEKKIFVKFIENTALIIDYSEKNPVNGRYRIISEKEVSFENE